MKERALYAVVVSAGSGKRMGFKKQHALLVGKPMWIRSVEAMFAAGVDFTVIVCAREDEIFTQEMARKQIWGDRCIVVCGGASRHASVQKGIQAAFMQYSGHLEKLLIAIHDAARPFVSHIDVQSVVELANQTGAAILVKACSDTVKQVQNGMISTTLLRSELRFAETPQIFRADLLKRTYFDEHIEFEPTDDASVFESLGIPVHFVESTAFNGKVTTPEDLEFAIWLGQKRWRGDSL